MDDLLNADKMVAVFYLVLSPLVRTHSVVPRKNMFYSHISLGRTTINFSPQNDIQSTRPSYAAG
jgi:hypothetical protein